MATEKGHEGRGIGKRVLDELISQAKKWKMKTIVLDARENAVGFYEKHGFRIIKEGHVLFGTIKHFIMRMDLE